MSVQLQDCVNSAWRLTGQASGSSLPSATSSPGVMAELYQVCEFINLSLRRVWNDRGWPETLSLEKRYFAPVFNANSTYQVGAQIYDPVTAAFWVCAVTTTAGQNPTNTPASWTALAIAPIGFNPPAPGTPELLPRIPLTSWNQAQQVRNDITGLAYGGTQLTGIATAASATATGTILALNYTGFPKYVQLLAGTNPMLAAAGAEVTQPSDYDVSTNNVKWLTIPPDGMGETPVINQLLEAYSCKDPSAYPSQEEIPYRMMGNGWVYFNPYNVTGSVYILIKRPVPIFTLTAYEGDTGYAFGQTAFYLGDTYIDAQLTGTSTGNTPSATSIAWGLQAFPERFFEYCSRAAAAEWKAKTGMKEQDVQASRQQAENAFTELNINFVQEENQGKFLGMNFPNGNRHGGWGGRWGSSP